MVDAPTNAFEAEIDQMIVQLGSKNPAKRREAAYFLGEVASEDAVAPLVEVYEKDRDASVRAAAAYSLGMYKAVEQALKRGEEDHVVELLEQIEDGKLGKRASIGNSVKLAIALVVSLLLLGGVYLFRTDIKGMVFGSDKTHEEVIAQVGQSFEMVRNDTRTLQSELLNVISNRPLSCIAYFNNPTVPTLDPIDARSYPDAAEINTELVTAYDSLTAAKVRYDDACNNGAEFGETQAQETFQLLLPALQTLDPLELKLTQAQAQSAPEPTVIPATGVPPTAASEGAGTAPTPETITTTTEVTAEATNGNLQTGVQLSPTIDPAVRAQANPKQYVSPLYNIIDDVTGPRGASALLVQYWTDVQESGSTSGCSITSPPTIPTNDIFIPEANFTVSPDLNRAVQLINSGLASLHDGWTKFQFACNSRTLQAEVNQRLADARVAQNAFEAAEVLLNQVQAAD